MSTRSVWTVGNYKCGPDEDDWFPAGTRVDGVLTAADLKEGLEAGTFTLTDPNPRPEEDIASAVADIEDETAAALEEGRYEDLSKGDLKAEIERRNEGREADDSMLVSGNKSDLVERLEADDASTGVEVEAPEGEAPEES